MARSVKDALAAARVTKTNTPGMSQQVTRGWFGAGSVGDVDSDGDAVDGWKFEPASARFTDRNPPAGAPVAWSGGSGGFGHRAIFLGKGMVRSTDAGGRGKVADRPLEWFEKTWGLKYLGWSKTISGQPIPGLESYAKSSRKTTPKKTRGAVLDRVIPDLATAKLGTGERAKQLKIAKAALNKVPYI